MFKIQICGETTKESYFNLSYFMFLLDRDFRAVMKSNEYGPDEDFILDISNKQKQKKTRKLITEIIYIKIQA
jgi:hypothetical protein